MTTTYTVTLNNAEDAARIAGQASGVRRAGATITFGPDALAYFQGAGDHDDGVVDADEADNLRMWVGGVDWPVTRTVEAR